MNLKFLPIMGQIFTIILLNLYAITLIIMTYKVTEENIPSERFWEEL